MVKEYINNKSSKRWTHSNTCVYNIGYHLIWCPKYRRKVLIGSVATRLKQILNQKAKELDAKIETMEIMEDHLHLFIKTKPTASPHWIVQQLKGFSSHQLRIEFPHLKSRLPTLWTRSYYCESVGHISEDVVKKYIEDQTGK
jgi:putative transposase